MGRLGESRYLWTHGIPYRKQDPINGQQVKRTRRVSLTIRKVREISRIFIHFFFWKILRNSLGAWKSMRM